MQVEGKLVNLSPGMAVTVEIKTGTRRIVEYLMSRLRRYRHESLRERWIRNANCRRLSQTQQLIVHRRPNFACSHKMKKSGIASVQER